MDFAPPCTFVPGTKSTYTLVRKTEASSVRGLICDARALLPAARRIEIPNKRRPGIQSPRQRRKTYGGIAVQRLNGSVIRAQHKSVGRRQERAAHRDGLLALRALDSNRPFNVFEKQLLSAYEIKLKLLCQDARTRISQRAEGHRSRVNERGDIGESYGGAAARKLHACSPAIASTSCFSSGSSSSSAVINTARTLGDAGCI